MSKICSFFSTSLSDYLTETETISDSGIVEDKPQSEMGLSAKNKILLDNYIENLKNRAMIKNNDSSPASSAVSKSEPQSLWQKVASFF